MVSFFTIKKIKKKCRYTTTVRAMTALLGRPLISLFSGCGALELGLSDWIWATDYVEINDYACKVLQKRMSEGLLHHAKIHRDVKTFKVPADTPARGAGGGFPCQGISCGGSQEGSVHTCVRALYIYTWGILSAKILMPLRKKQVFSNCGVIFKLRRDSPKSLFKG